MQYQYFKQILLLTGAIVVWLGSGESSVLAHQENHQEHQGHEMQVPAAKQPTLPTVPKDLPGWMSNKDKNHIYRKRGVYNDAIYNVKPLALDLHAIAVGHAFAYEDLVTGKAKDLETRTFEKITWVLKNPPRFMPDEANVSPTFGRKYGVLEQVFDWAHILHAQTVDVLTSTKMTPAEKEAEIERLYQFYVDNVPYAITGLPMNMGYLDSQPYSKAFRQKYPKVNGLFWGYHWLQGKMYDTLYEKSLEAQRIAYADVGKRYHEIELYRTDRAFMPMFAEVSPRFAQRFPQISNTFDNLHMLHDLVNDILASDWMTETQKEEQIQRAIWLVMAANHEGMKPGQNYGGEGLHDHRFMAGIPGMGLMPEGTTHDHGNMNPEKPMNDGTTGHESHDAPGQTHNNHDHTNHDHTNHDHTNHDHMNHEHHEHHEHMNHNDMQQQQPSKNPSQPEGKQPANPAPASNQHEGH